jgi:hypothetical protein
MAHLDSPFLALQSLGIHARWTSTIADWVHKNTTKPRLTFCVEGNVGSGKSTWLDMVKTDVLNGVHQDVHELIEVVPEPVDQWQNLQGDNLLELFYNDPARYAFTFQQYVLFTRAAQVSSLLESLHSLLLPHRCSIGQYDMAQMDLNVCVGFVGAEISQYFGWYSLN